MDTGSRMVEGYLKRTPGGRWQVHELELSAGSSVEVLSEQGWMKGYIEFDGTDYVFCDQKNESYAGLVDGLQARIRVTIH